MNRKLSLILPRLQEFHLASYESGGLSVVFVAVASGTPSRINHDRAEVAMSQNGRQSP